MDARTDFDLLEAIAGGDRAAFDLYFERHQHTAYSLAYHLTGRADMAEEAVQEALLRVWLAAKNVRADGNAEGWLKRIVARESVALARGKQKDRQKMERKRHLDPPRAPHMEDVAEKDELRHALLRKLGELRDADRQLVTLYFAAGMSQREIGEALDIPQRTVSNRIDEALGRLRSSLAQAGLAAAAPLVSGEGLRAALALGPAAPPGLRESVAEHVGRHAVEAAKSLSQRAAEHSTRTAAAKLGTGAWLALGLAGAAALVLGSMLVLSPPPAKPPSNQTAMPLPATAAPAPLNRSWSFAEGPPSDILRLQGDWAWKLVPALKRGEMAVPSSQLLNPLLAILPVPPPRRPFMLKIKVNYRGREGRSGIECAWLDKDEYLARRIWGGVLPLRLNEDTATTYFVGRHVIHNLDGKPTLLYEYDKDYPGAYLCLNLENLGLLDIQLREIELSEVPEKLRDIEALKAQLGNERFKVANHFPPVPEFWAQAEKACRP
ncbi:MAG: RNA polymerase sigma factor [Planctomycetes bacterium]|nr:RNA polymerase sigma factor [Planctomycetota bacterium]